MNQILKKDIKNINKEIRKNKLKIIRGLERENGKNCYMLDNYCENLESCLKMSGTKTCKLLQNKIDSSFLKYKFYLFSKIQFRSGNHHWVQVRKEEGGEGVELTGGEMFVSVLCTRRTVTRSLTLQQPQCSPVREERCLVT